MSTMTTTSTIVWWVMDTDVCEVCDALLDDFGLCPNGCDDLLLALGGEEEENIFPPFDDEHDDIDDDEQRGDDDDVLL